MIVYFYYTLLPTGATGTTVTPLPFLVLWKQGVYLQCFSFIPFDIQSSVFGKVGNV